MDYRKFLGHEEQLVFPYLGGAYVENGERKLRLKERPEEHGWWRFRVVGRNAWPLARVEEGEDREQAAGVPRLRGHFAAGYLFADGTTDLLELVPEEEPPALSPCKALAWPSGELIFEGVEFDTETETRAREALDEDRSIGDLKNVAATLRTAFAFALTAKIGRQRGMQIAPLEVESHLFLIAAEGAPAARRVLDLVAAERARALLEAEQAKLAAQLARNPPPPPAPPAPHPLDPTPWVTRSAAPLPPGMLIPLTPATPPVTYNPGDAAAARGRAGRGAPVVSPREVAGRPTEANAEERAEAVVEAAGATFRSARRLRQGQLEVRFRFRNQAFIAVVDSISLRVVDAGICLAGADRQVSLDSLPSVISEAIDTHRLVITRH
jgi:hypothetical protein